MDSRNSIVDPRTAEYEGMDQVTHVRHRPHNYIGSMIPTKLNIWTIELDPTTAVPQTPVRMKRISREICRPARHVFLELGGNAADNADESWRAGIDPECIEVKADQTTCMIRNFGKGIAIGKHASGMWLPEFIFGVLLTSSNFKKLRMVGGQNGYGAKLAVIFSDYFELYIVDPVAGLEYTQVWTEGMTKKSLPRIQATSNKKAETRITFRLDFNYFKQYGLSSYDVDWLGMLARHVADISLACKIPCFFNGVCIDCRKIENYAALLFPKEKINSAIVYRDKPTAQTVYVPTVEMIVLDTPHQSATFSFVNGMMTTEGGVHVDAALRAITQHIVDSINPKGESKDIVKLTLADVRPHVSLVISCRLPDPLFGGQTKEKLESPAPIINIPAKDLKQINECYRTGVLTYMFEAKNVSHKD